MNAVLFDRVSRADRHVCQPARPERFSDVRDYRTLPARIVSKIEPGPNGCWLWTGARDENGYARLRFDGKNALAHRVVYELLRGPIPDGLTLDHVRARGCRHRHCVNPADLEPTTLAVNIGRGAGVGVRNARKTHCARGHEFTPENTYLKGGKRSCRECGRQATRRWRERSAA